MGEEETHLDAQEMAEYLSYCPGSQIQVEPHAGMGMRRRPLLLLAQLQ